MNIKLFFKGSDVAAGMFLGIISALPAGYLINDDDLTENHKKHSNKSKGKIGKPTDSINE